MNPLVPARIDDQRVAPPGLCSGHLPRSAHIGRRGKEVVLEQTAGEGAAAPAPRFSGRQLLELLHGQSVFPATEEKGVIRSARVLVQ